MAQTYPAVPPGVHSPDFYEPNRGTHLRHPKHDRIAIPQTRSELTGPISPYTSIGEPDADLTRQHAGEPIGERIILHGRVFDEDGRPVPHTLVEIWQANVHGRDAHLNDSRKAPLDPNLQGYGLQATDAQGRFHFKTINPEPLTK
jgi:protocatechuate 3,4-dioxygenase beta subunit